MLKRRGNRCFELFYWGGGQFLRRVGLLGERSDGRRVCGLLDGDEIRFREN